MSLQQGSRRWYDLTFETLSPLHISLGPDSLLIPDEECDVDGDVTYVLDRAALIAEFQNRPPVPAPRLTYRDVLLDRDHPSHAMARKLFQAGWIQPDDPWEEDEPTEPSPEADWTRLATMRPRDLPAADKVWRTTEGRHLIHYLLEGTTDRLDGIGWWESISRLPRTPNGVILIPGSGIKGAVRSLLAYAMAERIGPERLPARDNLPKFAAQPLEQATLAPNAPRPNKVPNYDAGRLLLARDATLDATARARIISFGLRSQRSWRPFRGGTRQSAAAVEAVPPGVTFRAGLGIDVALLDGWSERSRGIFAPLRPVLTPDLGPLLAAGRAYAAAQLDADRSFYQGLDAPRAAALTEQLSQRLESLPANATLLRLGWGTGRASKTPFGVLLKRPFPRSRRLTVESDGQPGQPFGWVLCTVTPSER